MKKIKAVIHNIIDKIKKLAARAFGKAAEVRSGITIRQRLFWSNILMILVPVAAALAIGLACLVIIWGAVVDGNALDLKNLEDYNRACISITEKIEKRINKGKGLDDLDEFFEENHATAYIISNGETVYSFGEPDAADGSLIEASEKLANGSLISHSGRTLYSAQVEVAGESYIIRIFGSENGEKSYKALKTSIIIAAILISLTVVAAVFFTNRFLTGFVFRRIRKPLDILADGVSRISEGNLDYRIEYEQRDEFKPVCDAFNEMAGRLKEYSDMQQRNERSRKELIAGISHDIRSPLTSIIAYVEGLMEGIAKTPEAKEKYLRTIKTKADDLDHMVTQLFLFSKLELGDYPESTCKMRLDERLLAYKIENEDECRKKGLSIELETQPALISADPTRIDRVISNIVGNSLKYKAEENALLKIDLKAEGEKCLLSFEDNGQGVPEEALPHLFEVFYRSDPARKNPEKGSGLGLAIVSNIVSNYGGTVTARNGSIGGLRIEIELPCAEDTDEENSDN